MNESDGSERAVPDEERARQILEQLRGVHAFDLAYETMVGLVNFGTQKMGLHDETRGIRDLGDARLSIELVRALLDVIEGDAGDERLAGMCDALAQMQLAYAHAVQLAAAEQAPEDVSAETSPAVEETGGEVEAATPEEEPATTEPAEDAPADDEPASEKTATAKKTGGRKSATKKTTAKKPAAKKKPAQKKPADES